MQIGSIDCGVFSFAVADCLARGVEIDFQQSQVYNMRMRIAAGIAEYKAYVRGV